MLYAVLNGCLASVVGKDGAGNSITPAAHAVKVSVPTSLPVREKQLYVTVSLGMRG